MKKLVCLLFSLILTAIQHPTLCAPPPVDPQPNKEKPDIKCVDLADFYYEIILSVSSFPKQGDCSEQEEAEIASFLQDKVNDEVDSLPGTIKTKNKICSHPLNSRRQLLMQQNRYGTSTSPYNRTMSNVATSRPFFRPSQQNPRTLYRRGRRSFIYVGGGRCRFCFFDNGDYRALLPQTKDLSLSSHHLSYLLGYRHNRRDLLYVYGEKGRAPFPKVVDITLCKKLIGSNGFFLDFAEHNVSEYKKHVDWTNGKTTLMRDKEYERHGIIRDLPIMGPYGAGERFGVQVRMENATHVFNKIKRRRSGKSLVKQPVKEGIFHFHIWAFDLPTDLPKKVLADDPFYLFLNGIKLDFNLLVSQPGAVLNQTQKLVNGRSVAGIFWHAEWQRQHDEDLGYGSLPDRVYKIVVIAPFPVFAHKNQLDIDIIIKPNAKAKHYAFEKILVAFQAARCEVIGLENSRFEDFKSSVESRLFHKLGLDLANEFQGREGHCMYNKIPVVDVNLVEKQNWKDSNPQCS